MSHPDPLTEDEQDTLEEEWSQVYRRQNAGKDHLFEDCHKIKDKSNYSWKSFAVYPLSHADICRFCAESFREWRYGLGETDWNDCKRCGAETDMGRFCEECFEIVERRRTQREL